MSTAPDRTQHPGRAVTGLFYAALVALVAIAAGHDRGFIFDDPFIFFTYARNLADGHGWVFNVGQPGFDGATSPLYVVILAVLAHLDSNLVAVGSAVFVVSLAGAAALTHATLARLGHWWAGAAAALLVASSPWLFISRGMETPLFLALFALSVYLAVAERPWALGVALGLTILTRPDGVVMAAALLAWVAWRERRWPWRPVASLAAVGIAWLVYAEVVVGSLIPGTLAAKMAQGRSGLWNSIFAKGLWLIPEQYHFAGVEIVVLVLALAGVVALRAQRELRGLAIVVGGSGVVLFAAYVVLQVPHYIWYFAPLVYAAAVLGGVGLESLARRLTPALVRPAAVTLVAAALMVAGLAATPLGPPRPGYRAAAHWLDTHTAPDATVAAAEIGMLGWYGHRTMVDYDGLLSAATIPALTRGDLTWWIDALRPDYWMIHRPTFLEDVPVLEAPWFHQVFHRVYSNADVIIFRRVGLVPIGPMRILPPHLGEGAVGVTYWRRIAAEGASGPYTWRLVGGELPPGLHLGSGVIDFTHGVISGTPTRPGLYTFTVEVSGYFARPHSSATETFSLRVVR